MHPRMWEQYGDRYCGLALIFSKEELEQSNKSIHFSAVDYMPLESLISSKPFEGVDIDELKDMGQEQFVTDLKKRIIQESLQKTKDYAEENEFRAIAFSESSETEHMELDISTSIKAIAYFTNYPISEEKQTLRDECLSVARINGIDIIRITTNDNRLFVQTEKEYFDNERKWAEEFRQIMSEIEEEKNK